MRLAQHRKRRTELLHEDPGSSSVYGRGLEHLVPEEGMLREPLDRDAQGNDGIRAAGEPVMSAGEPAHHTELVHAVVGKNSSACVAVKALVHMLASDAMESRHLQYCLCVAAPEVIA